MVDIPTEQVNLRLRVETRGRLEKLQKILFVRSPADVIDRAVAELYERILMQQITITGEDHTNPTNPSN